MNYAMIVPAMMPSEYLDNCIKTLIQSDYNQDVYVVSHDTRCADVTRFGSNIKFVDSKSDTVVSPDLQVHNAFLEFDKEYDVIVYVHSDTFFYPDWWVKLWELWESVDTNKIYSIVVPHHKARRRDNSGSFTLSWDYNNSDYCNRWTPCVSYLTDSYKNVINKYRCNTYFTLEYLLTYESILARKWAMMANTGSLIRHIGVGDEQVIPPYDGIFSAYLFWEKRFGYSLAHFIGTWFGRVLINHADEIITKVNSGDFDSLDYIFDEVLTLLDVDNCTGCNIRCPKRDNFRELKQTKIAGLTK